MQKSTYNELLIYRARATCGETLLYSYYKTGNASEIGLVYLMHCLTLFLLLNYCPSWAFICRSNQLSAGQGWRADYHYSYIRTETHWRLAGRMENQEIRNPEYGTGQINECFKLGSMTDINTPSTFSAFLARWMMVRGDWVWDDALIIQNIFAFVCRSRQYRAIAWNVSSTCENLSLLWLLLHGSRK